MDFGHNPHITDLVLVDTVTATSAQPTQVVTLIAESTESA